jgi:molybdate transport system permease protein
VRHRGWFTALTALALAATLAFLVLPIVAMFLEVGIAEILRSLGGSGAREALALSIRTTVIAMVVILVVGTPTAYLLGTRSFRGHSLLVTLIELPLVLPPAVAGIALLAALGPSGVLGSLLGDAGIRLVFETTGVVVALVFVASPFYIRQAMTAFAALDPTVLEAARTLGAGEARTFVRVAIPGARPGLFSGTALAWGRALGEFGATLIFAGSLAGVTQTAPLAIAERFATDFNGAVALSAVLVALSAALLLAVKLVGGSTALPRASG